MKKKYYVVWQGLNPGIYDNWKDCQKEIAGYPNARYKGFPTKEEAEEALSGEYVPIQRTFTKKAAPNGKELPIRESIAVDAACSGNPGKMEYRGVDVTTGEELFHVGPYEQGTNNIGEFLALVHALALLKKNNSSLAVYTDSQNAIAWVKHKKCKTKLERTQKNEILFNLIERAEIWLSQNNYSTEIIKWNTPVWGEIPADFGRK